VPILKTLHETLQTQLTNSLPKSPLGMALQYTLARWDKLNVYTLDGNLRIDNNLVENSIRPVAIGRKNYMFAGNHEAAERSAMLYSLFATCKLHHVNPIQWLTYVFENINDQKINNIEQHMPLKDTNDLPRLLKGEDPGFVRYVTAQAAYVKNTGNA
jgi:hypothetical protein